MGAAVHGDLKPSGWMAEIWHTTVGFNVDDVACIDPLLLQAVIDGGVQLELLDTPHRLQANDNMADDFAVATCLSTGTL